MASANPYQGDQSGKQPAFGHQSNFGQPVGSIQANYAQPGNQHSGYAQQSNQQTGFAQQSNPQTDFVQQSNPPANYAQPGNGYAQQSNQQTDFVQQNIPQANCAQQNIPQANYAQPGNQQSFGQPSGTGPMFGQTGGFGQAQKGNQPAGIGGPGAENVPGGAAQFGGGGQFGQPAAANLYMQHMQRHPPAGSAPNAYQQQATFNNSNPYVGAGGRGMGGMGAGGMGAGSTAGRGAVARTAAAAAFVPLRELSCYNNKWVIKARVTVKGDRRKFANQRGEGQLFSVDLIDESGGETRATFFGKAVDTWYEYLQHGKVYSFTKGQVKPANRKFYTKSDYEITFDENAVIEKLDDAEGVSIPALQYNFVSLSSIATTEINTTVDVKGILVEVRDPITVSLKTGAEKRKRSLFIADESDTKCEFTIWGDKADQPYETGVAIFLKNARVGDFGGRNLSNQASCHIETAPDDRRAFDLKKWYESTGCSRTFTALANAGGGSNRTTIETMIEEDVSIGIPVDGKEPKKTHWHNVCPAYVAYIMKEYPPFYLACPSQVEGTDKDGKSVQRPCNKKSEPVPDREIYACANGHSCQRPTARFIARVKIQDYTNQIEATAFDEVGQKLFQADANEVWDLWEAKDKNDMAARQLEEVYARAFFTRWNMKIKSMKEQYQEEDRVKRQIMEITPVNVIEENQRYLEFLEKTA